MSVIEPKIIRFQVVEANHTKYDKVVFALCDDGTLWMRGVNTVDGSVKTDWMSVGGPGGAYQIKIDSL